MRPSLAGPKRPQDRVLLEDVSKSYRDAMSVLTANRKPAAETIARFAGEGGGTAVGHDKSALGIGQHVKLNDDEFELCDGAVVIAAITSCTNTSNPAVMLGAGLLAQKAVDEGPQGEAVGQDLARRRARRSSPIISSDAGLLTDLEKLGFYLVGYGCTTCIGNSGPLPDEISQGASSTAISSSRRCSRATATSKAACIPRSR